MCYFLYFIERSSFVKLDQDFLVKLNHQLAVFFEKVRFLFLSRVDLFRLGDLSELEQIIFLDQLFVVSVEHHLSAHRTEQNLCIFPPLGRIVEAWLIERLILHQLHINGKAFRARS